MRRVVVCIMVVFSMGRISSFSNFWESCRIAGAIRICALTRKYKAPSGPGYMMVVLSPVPPALRAGQSTWVQRIVIYICIL